MSDHLLEDALQRFTGGAVETQKLTGGTVSRVYAYCVDGQELVLRLVPPEAGLQLADMYSILHWMQFLADGGLSVPRPQVSRGNRLVEPIQFEGGTWLASVVERARGVRAETLPFEVWDDLLIEKLGKLVGKAHALARQYRTLEGSPARPQWNEFSNNYNSIEDMESVEESIRQRYQEAVQHIKSLPRDPQSYGLIHADVQCANFFVDLEGKNITLFDFDDCCYGWFVMDIALPLLDFLVLYPGADREIFASRFLDNFFRGYRSEYSLPESWQHELPHFLKLLEIALYAQVHAFAADCAEDSWVGKFMAGRKNNIENDLPFVKLNF